MTKVALRGIGARKLRALITWLAIFLGVALVRGMEISCKHAGRAVHLFDGRIKPRQEGGELHDGGFSAQRP